MKLYWFSPLPPAATDIAHFTTRVLPALSSRAEVTLWTEAAARSPARAGVEHSLTRALSSLGDIRTFDPGTIDWIDLNRRDACIYNIGNNPIFHGAIWRIARRHAGIVILHDTRLHNFFDGLYRVQGRDLPGYLEAMNFYYGEDGVRNGADCYRNEARNINEMAAKYPLTEHALENSLGVVVHTEQAFAELSERTARPVAYLPLPFAAPAAHRLAAGRRRPDDNQIYRLVMFGYIARNRRLEAVLQALHEMTERDRFHLDVFGKILDHEDRIKAQIRELGLKKLVTLHGFVPEEKLDEALSQADLAINLRYPTMGEASGSQLRIWAHALPSLVTKVGWYATLPANAVVHIRSDDTEPFAASGTEPLSIASGWSNTSGSHLNEVADIRSALRAFLDNPSRFAAMGERGRKILVERHSPETYAQGLIEFIEEAKLHRPRAAIFALAERAGATANQLLANTASDETLTHTALQIRELVK